jgi:hypothetical protein
MSALPDVPSERRRQRRRNGAIAILAIAVAVSFLIVYVTFMPRPTSFSGYAEAEVSSTGQITVRYPYAFAVVPNGTHGSLSWQLSGGDDYYEATIALISRVPPGLPNSVLCVSGPGASGSCSFEGIGLMLIVTIQNITGSPFAVVSSPSDTGGFTPLVDFSGQYGA